MQPIAGGVDNNPMTVSSGFMWGCGQSRSFQRGRRENELRFLSTNGLTHKEELTEFSVRWFTTQTLGGRSRYQSMWRQRKRVVSVLVVVFMMVTVGLNLRNLASLSTRRRSKPFADLSGSSSE